MGCSRVGRDADERREGVDLTRRENVHVAKGLAFESDDDRPAPAQATEGTEVSATSNPGLTRLLGRRETINTS